MSSKRQKQVGRRKEQPLAIVGIEAEGSKQQPIYNPANKEYANYSELIDGFLQILNRWQKIFTQEQHIYKHSPLQSSSTNDGRLLTSESMRSHFKVLKTPEGLVISPIDGGAAVKPNTVLYADTWNNHFLPIEPPKIETDRGYAHSQMSFKPGSVGKDLLVDPEGKPLKEVFISIGSYWGGDWRELKMYAYYAQPSEPERDIKYTFRPSTLEVSKMHPFHERSALMPEAYQIHLFNTIDALIPGSTSPTQQPERREKHRLQAPNAPLPARRRKPGR